MGKFYGLKIKTGIMAIEEVPKLWKAVTENWLSTNEGA